MGRIRRFATALGIVGVAVFAAVLLSPVPALSVSPTGAVSSRLLQTPQYGSCGFPTPPDPTAACRYYHPAAVNLVGTGFCIGGECFEMHYGDYTRVVAADDLGPFPKTWFVWPETGALDNTYPGDRCEVTIQGHKTRVDIPEDNPRPRCKAELTVGDYLYHEHFSSNSTTRCLGWLECREDLITPR